MKTESSGGASHLQKHEPPTPPLNVTHALNVLFSISLHCPRIGVPESGTTFSQDETCFGRERQESNFRPSETVQWSPATRPALRLQQATGVTCSAFLGFKIIKPFCFLEMSATQPRSCSLSLGAARMGWLMGGFLRGAKQELGLGSQGRDRLAMGTVEAAHLLGRHSSSRDISRFFFGTGL